VGLVRRQPARELEDAVSRSWLFVTVVMAASASAAAVPAGGRGESAAADAQRSAPQLFTTGEDCLACHNGLRTPSGEDVSIGTSWRASIMANSARDPYWQAAVRRETLDHPTAAAAIQDDCSVCHMPMARTEARARGRWGRVFAHLPVRNERDRADRLAHDGVSCTICHQITGDKLGTPASFTGGYVVDASPGLGKSRGADGARTIFGPFDVDSGLGLLMHSATRFRPAESAHVRQSELCATCHTLFTKALGAAGEVVGELPEQMPYLEWRHSAFRAEARSCQSCHMRAVTGELPIASVLGQPRQGLARHGFVGGNAFMLRMLHRYRSELGVAALAEELDEGVRQTVQNLESATAEVTVERAEAGAGTLTFDVVVSNLTGHKLPTGYPSRRAWLHVTVRDRSEAAMFESGALAASGSIVGNANDGDPSAFEPHYELIDRPDRVQIYESIMIDRSGAPTTGLLSGVGYVKDNRLLPRGFQKEMAAREIAVVGGASADADFAGGGDRVRYRINVNGRQGPLQVDVELRLQTIGFRWAQNLKKYDASEPRRFVAYYDAMAGNSSEVLARASVTARE
jgi:hypothetical protein